MPTTLSRHHRFISVSTKMNAVTLSVLVLLTAAVYVGLSRFEREKLIGAKEQAARMAEQLFIRAASTPVIFEDDTGMTDTVGLLAKDPEVLGVELWKTTPARAVDKRLVGTVKPGEAGAAPRYVDHLEIERSDDRLTLHDAVRDTEGKVIAVASVQISLAAENAAYDQLRTQILLAAGGGAVFLGFVLWLVSRRTIIAPLGRLVKSVRRVEAGAPPAFDAAANDEVGRLAEAFARMADAVARRERDIARRSDDLKRVLDNVGQGFLVFDLAGQLASERSAIVDRWFGAPAAGATIVDFLATIDADRAEMLDIGLEGLRDGFMPTELCLDQLPRRLELGERTFAFAYHPIFEPGSSEAIRQIVLVISDVSAEVERDRAERSQKDLVAAVSRLMADKAGFLDFVGEAGALVDAIADAPATAEPALVLRDLHTLKGITAVFGLTSLANLCHALEDEAAELGAIPSADSRASVRSTWQALREKISVFGVDRRLIELTPDEYRTFASAIRDRVPYDQILAMVERWSYEPVRPRLERLGQHAAALAARLGKCELAIELACDGARLPTEPWSQLWPTLIHVVRNAVDHGIETAAERVSAGKSARAHLELRLVTGAAGVTLAISDDGRGIDWEALRAKARRLGLPHATHEDLVAAMFADGVSTRDVVSDTSGRGVGLAAVRHAVAKLGGAVRIDSQPGRGTTFELAFASTAPARRSATTKISLGGLPRSVPTLPPPVA